MTMLAAFGGFIGIFYAFGRGLNWVFGRLSIPPSVEAVIRVLLSVAAGVIFALIMRRIEALSLP